MHVQIINFRLNGIGDHDYTRLCENLAPAFSAVPGLVQKFWLADYDAGVFGGVYLWKDRRSMDRFIDSELFRLVASHPNLMDISSRDFGVIDSPTRVTRGFVDVGV